MRLCEFKDRQKWTLLYRASEDGFSGESFHKKCDGFKNTLTVITSTSDNIFGGYTGAAWNQSEDWIYDTDSFIFSLINKLNSPFKSNCIKNEYSIYGGSSFGPVFGDGHDLHIASNSDKNQYNCSNVGYSYECAQNNNSILAGSRYFKTKEIEVYKEKY